MVLLSKFGPLLQSKRKIGCVVALTASLLFLTGCAGPPPQPAKTSGTAYLFYGEFCGPKVPRLDKDLSLSDQLAALARLKPRDDVDRLCRAHDSCYLKVAMAAPEAEQKNRLKVCDDRLAKAVEPLRQRFAELQTTFSTNKPGPPKPPTEEQVAAACKEVAFTEEDVFKQLRQANPKTSAALVRRQARRHHQAYCYGRAKELYGSKVSGDEALAGTAYIRYRRCRQVTEAIATSISDKKQNAEKFAAGPLSASLIGFAWISRDGLPRDEDLCNQRLSDDMADLLRRLPQRGN